MGARIRSKLSGGLCNSVSLSRAFLLLLLLVLTSGSGRAVRSRDHLLQREGVLIGYQERSLSLDNERETLNDKGNSNVAAGVPQDKGQIVEPPVALPRPTPLPTHIAFTTAYGTIKARLLRKDAPQTVEYVEHLLSKGIYEGCSFYRAEPAGETLDPGQDRARAGYALLQGGAYSCGRQQERLLPLEGPLPLIRGAISLIAPTSEFFIAVEAHPEWFHLFTVWAQVEDSASFQSLDALVMLPTKFETSAGTVLRVLKDPVLFNTTLLTE